MQITKLRDYQLIGARQIRDWGGRILLADEMGLGKTLQALFYVYKTPASRPVVVVCPVNVKLNWEREAAHHLGLPSEVLEGRKVRRFKPATRAPLVIINYDILGPWLPYLKALGPGLIILDEIHYIKNRASQRYRAARKLCERVPRVIGLSGTPLTNRPSELWAPLSVIRPDIFRSFYKFVFRWTKPRHFPWGWDFSGARDLDVLHAHLKELCMVRRLKRDVLQDLPPKVREVLMLRLPDRTEYDTAQADFLGWLRTISIERARRAARAEALTRIGYLLRLCAKLKLKLVYEWVDNFLEGSDGKLVVFSMHRRMVELLHARYHRQSVVVDGGVKGRQRQRAVDAFQHKDNVRLFLGNIRAAGIGITLTAADTCVFTDLPWTPGDLVQAEDRIHRIGQKETAFIYYLVAYDTIEEKLCKLLQRKQSILEEVLDGQGRGDNLNIFNELLRSVYSTQKDKSP